LGVPLPYSKLRKEDLHPVIDKIIKGIAGWRGRLLFYRACLILLQTCVASIPLYLLSIIKFPSVLLKLLVLKWLIFFLGLHP
jgi:hypothetical protein